MYIHINTLPYKLFHFCAKTQGGEREKKTQEEIFSLLPKTDGGQWALGMNVKCSFGYIYILCYIIGYRGSLSSQWMARN